MSQFSGKCDLADWIAGQGGWFDKNGNPVKIGDKNVHVYYSDEMLDFKAFKESTGGVLHQHKKVKVDELNQDDVAKHCPDLIIHKHEEVVKDKRVASGEKTKTTYTYTYWGKEYTLKELNKHGVWVTIDIHFDTLLDLIPYYPYNVSIGTRSDDKQVVYISDQSYVIKHRDSMIETGHFNDYWEHYQKELQKHYMEVVLEYFNPVDREVEEELNFFDTGNGRYIAFTKYPIDENIEVKWVTEKSRWTSPKRIGKTIIEMSKKDFECYLGNKCKVYYARAKDRQERKLK